MRPRFSPCDITHELAADAKEPRDGRVRLPRRRHPAYPQNVALGQLGVWSSFASWFCAVQLFLLAVFRASRPANVVRVYADAIATAMRRLCSLKRRGAMSEQAHAARCQHRASVDVDLPVPGGLAIRPRDAIVGCRANMPQKKRLRFASPGPLCDAGLIESVTGLAPSLVVPGAKPACFCGTITTDSSAGFHNPRYTSVHSEAQQ